MVHTAIKTIKKYLKIYVLLSKFSLIEIMTYRVSLFVELAVEFGYQVAMILFFSVIYRNINQIAGWSIHEVYFLLGLNIITSEVILGVLCIFNLRRLPEKIRTGALDTILTKPLHSLFQVSLGKPYVVGFLSTISGFFLMYYSLDHLTVTIQFINVIVFIVMMICGFAIAFVLLVFFASLSFLFENTKTFPKIGEEIFFYKQNPHHIYRGMIKFMFFYLFPVIFVTSVPTSTLIKGIEWDIVLSGILIAFLGLLITVKIWNRLIRYYSSASS